MRGVEQCHWALRGWKERGSSLESKARNGLIKGGAVCSSGSRECSRTVTSCPSQIAWARSEAEGKRTRPGHAILGNWRSRAHQPLERGGPGRSRRMRHSEPRRVLQAYEYELRRVSQCIFASYNIVLYCKSTGLCKCITSALLSPWCYHYFITLFSH